MKSEVKKICIVGHFGFGLNYFDGQTIKTKTVAKSLDRQYGRDNVLKQDTHGGIKSLLIMPFRFVRILKNAENVIIMPAQRGVRIMLPLLAFLNRFYHRKLHYCVIGGWLPELLDNHRFLLRYLKSFNGIYVETTVMKTRLEDMGVKGVYIVPNCKFLNPLKAKNLTAFEQPYRLCIFSRIMREKGIEDAVDAVKNINGKFAKTVFCLDIYGQVDPEQNDWFEALKLSFPEYVSYKGIVRYEESADSLKDYYALLFPTHFYTEGIPGTIIDAYAAGVPVISARWESFSDIVEEGRTGLGYTFNDRDGLVRVLSDVCAHPDSIGNMRENCTAAAEKYLPQNAFKILFEQIGV